MKTPVAAVVVIAVVILATAIAVLIISFPSPLSDNANCPTGSAICVTAAMMPGAVTVMSTFILFTILASITFVILYIRSKS